MKKLIVAATQHEVGGLYDHFNLDRSDFVETVEFDILITGVGMTATAYALGKHLSAGYELVLNLGIAGSFDHRIPLGTVLQVVSDEFAELGAEDKEAFISIDDLGFGKSKYQRTGTFQHSELNSLPSAAGITVNKVHGNSREIELIKTRLNPVTESMEGAAVFYCCAQSATPCLQIRAISNYVEERNKAGWEINTALKNLNEWAISFLTKP